MRTFCLSVHAAYRCRHAGACCTAPWRIPIEPATLHGLRSRPPLARILDRGYDAPYVPRLRDGRCVFFESDEHRRCTIHRVAGPELLPSACRHFPRVALRDRRGTFVTLSSFCPTAAAMLQDDGPLGIVEAPDSVALGGALEGLDATAVLPPLLRAGVLMDYDGYTAWEHAAIALLDRDDRTAGDAVDALAAATARVQRWTPGTGTLAAHVAACFAPLLTPSADSSGRPSRPLRMFLAAHLFGSWAAYQNGGLDGVIDAVRTARALAETELASGAPFAAAVAAVDLKLRHTEEHAGA